MLTGVSKFSKVSLFSDLNNLRDITLEPPFSSICGYTDDDVDTVFAREIEGLDREAMREWYNGYSWLGEQRVYNPFDILLLLAKRTFSAHWFETGTPRFLIDTLLERSVAAPSLEGMFCTDDLLSAFDVEEIGTEALLFQIGYLTIADVEDAGGSSVYRLGYPNREVRQSLNNRLLRAMAPDPSAQIGRGMALRRALDADDFPAIEALFRAFFASIPHNWFVRNRIADFEGYYASVFCSHFASAGLDVAVEDATGAGRLDMAVRHAESVHLFEFKVAESSSPGAALAQLRERRYAEKYRAPGRTIHLIGVEFSRRERNISQFDVAAG